MPAPDIQLREATIEDIPALTDLLRVLFSQEADFTPDANLQSTGLRLILTSPETGRIYCACEGNTVLGMVSILFTVSTAMGARVATLEDMIIHPGWRGKKIGERLLHEAIRHAREFGCKRITLLTDGANTPAINFYSRAGFKKSGMIPLRLSL